MQNIVPFICSNVELNIRYPAQSTLDIRAMKPFYTFLAALLLSAGAAAQTPAKNDETYRYAGADRDARLVQRAKQEGLVVLYTSLAPTESRPLAEAFEKKYG